MSLKNTKLSFDKMRNLFFFGLIIFLTIAILYIIRPFFYPIFWAAVIAIMFYPLYQWLSKHFKTMPKVNSFLTIVCVVIVLMLPLALITTLLVKESIDVYQSVSLEDLRLALAKSSEELSGTFLAPYLEQAKQEWPMYAQKAVQAGSGFLYNSALNITQNSLRFIFMLFVMFYSLYYFLKDGKKILKRLSHLSPLGDKYEKMLFERFTSTTRATLRSTLIVGGTQGILSGLLFWSVGIEGAFIWGVIMVILAIIPAIGPALVIVPAAVIMLALGNIWQAIALLIGAFIVSMIDNFMRPPLIGKDIQMHPLVVFLATLGGIILFNVSGFIIGPIIAALYISTMTIYDHYYKHELQNN